MEDKLKALLNKMHEDAVTHDLLASRADANGDHNGAAQHRGARDALRAALAFAADIGMNVAENTLGIGTVAL